MISLAHKAKPTVRQRAAEHHRALGAAQVEHATTDLRGRGEAGEEDQQIEPGVAGVVAQRDLRVDRGEEEHRDERDLRKQQHGVVDDEGPVAEDLAPGSAGLRSRSSNRAKTPSTSSPPMMQAQVPALRQPQLGACSKPSTDRPIPTATSTGAAARRCARADGCDGMCAIAVSTSAMTAIGMLIQKMARHVHCVR